MKVHIISGYIQSIYLVEYDHGLMLLDGASRQDVQTICQYITEQLGRPTSDLKLVIATHMHPDHAGGAYWLAKHTGCKTAAANVAGHWYTGVDGFLMHWSDMVLAKWVAKRKGKRASWLWYPRQFKFDHYLEDGEVIPGFEEWQALFTQGHTDRDLSLWHANTKTVYVADLIVKVKGSYRSPYPVFYPNRYKASVIKVANLDPEYVMLAHDGKIPVGEINWGQVLDSAPHVPVTHWRSVKHKLTTALPWR